MSIFQLSTCHLSPSNARQTYKLDFEKIAYCTESKEYQFSANVLKRRWFQFYFHHALLYRRGETTTKIAFSVTIYFPIWDDAHNCVWLCMMFKHLVCIQNEWKTRPIRTMNWNSTESESERDGWKNGEQIFKRSRWNRKQAPINRNHLKKKTWSFCTVMALPLLLLLVLLLLPVIRIWWAFQAVISVTSSAFY